METCKICGKNNLSQLSTHVRMKHEMTMEEYEKFEVEVTGDSDPIFDEEEKQSTSEDRIKKIFNVEEPDPDRLLQSFLDEFVIDEKTLREVVRSYKKESRVSVTTSLKNKQDWAKNEVSKYLDKTDVEVGDVFVAELLEKEHGFKTVSVRSGPPKRYILKKL